MADDVEMTLDLQITVAGKEDDITRVTSSANLDLAGEKIKTIITAVVVSVLEGALGVRVDEPALTK